MADMDKRFVVTREDGAFAVWDHERHFFAEHDGPRCMRKQDAERLAATLNGREPGHTYTVTATAAINVGAQFPKYVRVFRTTVDAKNPTEAAERACAKFPVSEVRPAATYAHMANHTPNTWELDATVPDAGYAFLTISR